MIARGRIESASPQGLMIRVPYDPRFVTQQWDEVEVMIPDGRRISPDQRRKAYALMGEIAAWAGMETEEVKLVQKHDFVQKHLEGLHKELFSLSDCDMSTAREFITYLIDFVLEFDVPLKIPIMDVVDDVQKYVYSCLMHKKCAVCGKKTELHHVDRVGMGNNRNEIMHLGRLCLPLCREHHIEIDHRGDDRFCEYYHIEPVEIDDKIAKLYRLRGKRS